MKNSPAFQFYPTEFLGDQNVALMSNEEIGCYIKLLCHCWTEGSIPSEMNKISKLCGVDKSVMAQLWLAIEPCFTFDDKTNRLFHKRLLREREKQIAHRMERSQSGKKGAVLRWQNEKSRNKNSYSSAIAQPSSSHSSVIAEHIANYSSLSLTKDQKQNQKHNLKSKAFQKKKGKAFLSKGISVDNGDKLKKSAAEIQPKKSNGLKHVGEIVSLMKMKTHG
jgi:uncharacterized protein YdaU (DUF1376 family)